jgi:hypothetical protein
MHASFNSEGLRLLRDIAFHLHGLSFKVDVRGNAVWIRMMEANQGTQQTIAGSSERLQVVALTAHLQYGPKRDSLP